MERCPVQDLVDLYAAQQCSVEEQRIVTEHLHTCGPCRDHLAGVEPLHSPPPSTEASPTITDGINSESTPTIRLDTPPQDVTKIIEDVDPDVTIATPAASSSDDTNYGSQFAGYEITEELPRGGQAVVFKAIHTATNTKVVIKVLLPSLLASARARYYFEREAEVMASLNHPNIVGIRDSGIMDNQYFFVMNYIQGISLERHVRHHKLSQRECVKLFIKICNAVIYAHQQGIIHRDLKFANILVDEYQEPYILDFGLAKAIGAAENEQKDAVMTMTGQLTGTLSTMSPEQASGKPSLIDTRTDIYALGIMLYHLLTGQYPYDVTGSTLEIIKRIQEQDPLRPSKLFKRFDSDLEAIVLTALAKNPEERYQSTANLRNDLNNWLQGLPIRVKSVSTMYLLRKIIARHRLAATVVALLIIILTSLTSISTFFFISAKKAEKDTEKISKQWHQSYLDHSVFAQSLAFSYFLSLWHQNDIPRGNLARLSLPAKSKERIAADYLVKQNNTTVIQDQLSEEHLWFAELVDAELHTKAGNKGDALKAYQRSYNALKSGISQLSPSDHWLSNHIMAKLYEYTQETQQPNQ